MSDRLTLGTMYEVVAEVGFQRYFHLGGFDATRALIKLCQIGEDSTVLDVGCASGKTACYLARTVGCQVTGVDILPRMIERANQRADSERVRERVAFWVGDARALPLDDDRFDVVLGEFVTGLVDDSEKVVREYVRVARAGGTIGLNDGTLLEAPLPPRLAEFVERTLGYTGEILTSEKWVALLAHCGVKVSEARVFKADSLGDSRENLKDLVRALPNMAYAFVRRPVFRDLMKASLSIPKDLLDYLGYGLYIGRV